MPDDRSGDLDLRAACRRALRWRPRSQSLRLLLLGLVAALLLSVLYLQNAPDVLEADDLASLPALDFEPLPDFASIDDVRTRKQRFFDYLQPMIEARNARIQRIRAFLIGIRERVSRGLVLGPRELARLEQLAERYRIELRESGRVGLSEVDALLRRADVLPPSLVLAQAATESAWGTSRFARTGNNLFGEWCYTPGCGVVPRRRPGGAKHEVEAFEHVYASVDSYFRNLNSHEAYADVRALRAQARARGEAVTGMNLVAGLERYSQRRGAYVDEIRNMIRVNDLTQLDARLREASVSRDAAAP